MEKCERIFPLFKGKKNKAKCKRVVNSVNYIDPNASEVCWNISEFSSRKKVSCLEEISGLIFKPETLVSCNKLIDSKGVVRCMKTQGVEYSNKIPLPKYHPELYSDYNESDEEPVHEETLDRDQWYQYASKYCEQLISDYDKQKCQKIVAQSLFIHPYALLKVCNTLMSDYDKLNCLNVVKDHDYRLPDPKPCLNYIADHEKIDCLNNLKIAHLPNEPKTDNTEAYPSQDINITVNVNQSTTVSNDKAESNKKPEKEKPHDDDSSWYQQAANFCLKEFKYIKDIEMCQSIVSSAKTINLDALNICKRFRYYSYTLECLETIQNKIYRSPDPKSCSDFRYKNSIIKCLNRVAVKQKPLRKTSWYEDASNFCSEGFQYSSEIEKCQNLIKSTKRMDKNALKICKSLQYSSEKFECLKVIKDKRYKYPDPKPCEKFKYKSEKIRCLKRLQAKSSVL